MILSLSTSAIGPDITMVCVVIVQTTEEGLIALRARLTVESRRTFTPR